MEGDLITIKIHHGGSFSKKEHFLTTVVKYQFPGKSKIDSERTSSKSRSFAILPPFSGGSKGGAGGAPAPLMAGFQA
jgi:hypothetical protein